MSDAHPYQTGLWTMEVLAYDFTDDAEAMVHRSVHEGWTASLARARSLAKAHAIVEIVVDDPDEGAHVIWEHRQSS